MHLQEYKQQIWWCKNYWCTQQEIGSDGICSCSVRVMNRELQNEHTSCENSSLPPYSTTSLMGRELHYFPKKLCFRHLVYIGRPKCDRNTTNPISFIRYDLFYGKMLFLFWPQNNKNFQIAIPTWICFIHCVFLIKTKNKKLWVE